MNFFADLHREFAGWAEDEDLWIGELDVEFRKSGERESRGFSRSGGGKSDQILAQQGGRNTHRLDR